MIIYNQKQSHNFLYYDFKNKLNYDKISYYNSLVYRVMKNTVNIISNFFLSVKMIHKLDSNTKVCQIFISPLSFISNNKADYNN